MASSKEKKSKHSTPNTEGDKKPFMKFYWLAFELVIANIGLIVGGYYLDKVLSTSPAFILVGTLMAMTFTIWLLLKSTAK